MDTTSFICGKLAGLPYHIPESSPARGPSTDRARVGRNVAALQSVELCKICDLELVPDKEALSDHIGIHAAERSWCPSMCSECKIKFAFEKNLLVHQKAAKDDGRCLFQFKHHHEDSTWDNCNGHHPPVKTEFPMNNHDKMEARLRVWEYTQMCAFVEQCEELLTRKRDLDNAAGLLSAGASLEAVVEVDEVEEFEPRPGKIDLVNGSLLQPVLGSPPDSPPLETRLVHPEPSDP